MVLTKNFQTGFKYCPTLASASNSICQQQRNKTPSVTPIIQWPGIEAVIESYKKYSQGNYYDTRFLLIPYCTEVAIKYLINFDFGPDSRLNI